ncbi:MAG: hypothetical protein HY028_11415 [Gammaproteobacteria bacterium]|nr:hypothetical protein [Gammaproteobacteria bacterium]
MEILMQQQVNPETTIRNTYLDIVGSRKVNLLATGFIGLLIVVYGLMVSRFALNVPKMDDFIQFLGYQHYLAQSASIKEQLLLFLSQPAWDGGPQTEHRIVVARLAMFFSQALFGTINFTFLIILGNVFLVLLFVLLIWHSPYRSNKIVVLPVAILLFSLIHYEASFWSSGALLYYPAAFFSLVTFHFLADNRAPGLAVPASAAGGILAVFSQSNGLIVFPVATFALGLAKRYRMALLFLLFTVLSFWLYFWDFSRPGAVPGYESPMQAAYLISKAWVNLLGCAFSRLSLPIGLLLIGAWLVLLRRQYWKKNIVLFCFGGWLVGTMLSIAIGRGSLDYDYSTISRYRLYSALFASVTYLAILEMFVDREKLKQAVFYAFMTLTSLVYLYGTPLAYALATSERIDAVHDADFYHIAGVTPYSEDGFPTARLANHLITLNGKLGTYTYPSQLGKVALPRDVSQLSIGDPSSLSFKYARIRFQDKVIAVRGDARLSDGWCGNTETLVVVAAEDRKYYFKAERYSRPRYREVLLQPCRQFSALVNLHGIPPGSYRLGIAIVREGTTLFEQLSEHSLVVGHDKQ